MTKWCLTSSGGRRCPWECEYECTRRVARRPRTLSEGGGVRRPPTVAGPQNPRWEAPLGATDERSAQACLTMESARQIDRPIERFWIAYAAIRTRGEGIRLSSARAIGGGTGSLPCSIGRQRKVRRPKLSSLTIRRSSDAVQLRFDFFFFFFFFFRHVVHVQSTPAGPLSTARQYRRPRRYKRHDRFSPTTMWQAPSRMASRNRARLRQIPSRRQSLD